jgi:hypothetical protein
MTHEELMVEAINWMGKTQPEDPARTPSVGAVIAIDGVPQAADCRFRWIAALHRIYIVKANDLGMAFVEYYRRVVRRQHQAIEDAVNQHGLTREQAH